MATSHVEQKREQRRQALQNIGLPGDLAWADMTSEQRAAFHSESMRLYHQRKGNGNQGNNSARVQRATTGEGVPQVATVRASKPKSPRTPSTPVEPTPKWLWYATGVAFAAFFGMPFYLAWRYRGN